MPLQQIRKLFLQEKPTLDPTKSARQNDGDNKQCRGSTHEILNTNTSQDQERADERRTDQITSIDQWKYSVRCVKPWRRSTQTPHANNESGILYDTDGLRVCATIQSGKLPTNDGDHTRASACNQMVPTKPIIFQKMYHREQITKKYIAMAVQPVFLS